MNKFRYRNTVTNKKYKSRLGCAWDIYKGLFSEYSDDLSTKIMSGFVLTAMSPVWFPIIYFEPFPFQKPGRIEKIKAADSSLDE